MTTSRAAFGKSIIEAIKAFSDAFNPFSSAKRRNRPRETGRLDEKKNYKSKIKARAERTIAECRQQGFTVSEMQTLLTLIQISHCDSKILQGLA